MRVGVVAQRDNAAAVALAEDIVSALPETVEVVIDPETATHLPESGGELETLETTDLVVSIGGDGTFLFAARHVGTTPVLGVNLGEVGFLNAVTPEDAVETTLDILEEFQETSSIETVPLPRLAAGGGGISLSPAINEIVVQGPQRGRGYGIDMEIAVGDATYAETHADGVLVATPTGSTAYNLSEGGPLITPTADVLVVTPMSPTTATRSLVVPTDASIDISVAEAATAIALSDGRDATEFQPPETITIETAVEPAQVAGPGVEFFSALGKLD